MKILLSFCVRAFLVIAAVAAVDAGRVAADPREIDALSAQSRHLMFDSKIDEAIPLAEQALAMAEKQLGKETAKYAQLANRLAVLYRSKSRFGEAEQLLKHAIAVREAADPNQLVDSLNDLGLIYWDTGRYAEAEPLLRRCLEQYATRRGPKHEYTATAATNLALLYRDMGRFDDAERYMLQGKGIREELAGPVRDVELSNSLNNLAGLLRERGRYAEAEPLARQAVEIRTRVHGLEHRDVATSMNVLAEILRATGQYAEAETLLGTTLSIRRARLGAEDVRVASSLNSLGGVYEGLGRLKEAEAAYQQGLQIREKHLKATYPNHPDIATSQANLGALLKSQFRYTEAEPLLRSALDIRERTLGAAHPDTLKSMIQLADLVRARGRKSEADQLFDRALSIRRSAVKQVDVHFATNRNKLTNTKTLAFGSERANRLTFGLANVWVPTEITADKAKTQPAMAKAGGATSANEATEVARLNIRDKIELQQPDFVRRAGQTLNLARIFPRQALLFVHGFNVSFDNALKRAAQVAYDLDFDGPVFLFAWPSRGGDSFFRDVRGIFDYTTDSKSAAVSSEFMRQFVEEITDAIRADKLHIIAHSMGNLAMLEALKVSADRRTLARARIGELILASPDVERDRFVQLMAGLRESALLATLYASSSDRALMASQRFWGNLPVGYVASGGEPTIVENVESVDVTAAGDTFLGLNHDIFASNPAITADMRLILARSVHPPDTRAPTFERRFSTAAGRNFWVFRSPSQK